ncbi:hypothetical protein Tco_0133365 [Tanacetum coccineum]
MASERSCLKRNPEDSTKRRRQKPCDAVIPCDAVALLVLYITTVLSWNGPKDFAKLVKAISLPQDVPSTSDRCLIELENQVQRLMEAYLAPKQYVQVNKITSSCEICSGLHDTQYCIENPEQAFVEYASSRNNKVGGKQFTTNQGPRSFNEATNA